MSWNHYNGEVTEKEIGHPPFEDVSWNYQVASFDEEKEVILLVRMWVEILFQSGKSYRRRCHPPCEDVSWNMLKYNTMQHEMRHPPCEDVSWNIYDRCCCVTYLRHPPCEDVSWNGIACSINLDGAVILLMIQHQAFACHETQYAKEFEQLEC